MKTTINSIGLVMASLGSFVVWAYLGDLNMADTESLKKGEIVLVVPTTTPELCAKLLREKLWSRCGLGLILVGGLLQIVSNYMPESA